MRHTDIAWIVSSGTTVRAERRVLHCSKKYWHNTWTEHCFAQCVVL